MSRISCSTCTVLAMDHQWFSNYMEKKADAGSSQSVCLSCGKDFIAKHGDMMQ